MTAAIIPILSPLALFPLLAKVKHKDGSNGDEHSHLTPVIFNFRSGLGQSSQNPCNFLGIRNNREERNLLLSPSTTLGPALQETMDGIHCPREPSTQLES